MTIFEALPLWYYATIVGMFGLAIGSFLNVVIYRVPNKMTLMGRSYCPKCDHLIRAYDNIPVFSWLFLGAKCRDCKQPISWRYPFIEALHTLAWVGIVVVFGPTQPFLVPLLLFFASVSIALMMIDFDTMTLPNVIVYPSIIISAVYLTILAALTNAWANMATSALAAVVLCLFYFAIYVLSRGRGLGFGDVKLALVLGLMLGWFGWGAVIVGTFAAFFIGGIPGAILMATGVIKKGKAIPFGPMLLIGAWFGMLWGPQIWDAYLKLAGL